VTGATRDTRVGWPLLTAETEANVDSRITKERESFHSSFIGPLVPVQEIFAMPWLL
jgi:hypothetical protein